MKTTLNVTIENQKPVEGKRSKLVRLFTDRRSALLILALSGCTNRPAEPPPPPPAAVAAPARPQTASGLLPVTDVLPDVSVPALSPIALSPTDLDPQAAFGESVAIDGSIVVTGAPGRLFSDKVVPSVHVYERTGNRWLRTARLVGTGRYFGDVVAVHGETIAVSAKGTVFIFGRKGKTWTKTAEIPWPDADTPDADTLSLSVSLALAGDTLAVGSDGYRFGRGVVVLYERTGGIWKETSRLHPYDVEQDVKPKPGFGWRLAFDGERLMASSRQARCDGVDMCGAVYIWERADGGWKETLHLPERPLVRWAGLGRALAAEGGLMAIACDGEKRAWMLEHTPAGWRDAGTLETPVVDGVGNDQTIYAAVAVHGRFAALSVVPTPKVGMPPVIPGTREIDLAALGRQRASSGGTVHLYARQAGRWKSVQSFRRAADPGDEHGRSLALGDGILVAGAPGAHLGRGEVIIYQAP